MQAFVDHPGILFVVLFTGFTAAIAFGALGLRRIFALRSEEREDFTIVETSTLTLLALLIGFNLSMAVNRYDQRKNLSRRAKPTRSGPSTFGPTWLRRPSARR